MEKKMNEAQLVLKSNQNLKFKLFMMGYKKIKDNKSSKTTYAKKRVIREMADGARVYNIYIHVNEKGLNDIIIGECIFKSISKNQTETYCFYEGESAYKLLEKLDKRLYKKSVLLT